MTLFERLGLKTRQPLEVETSAPPREFFFVRGHPRTGTNWVEALLNLHPQINCFGEFHFEDIRNAIDELQNQPWQLMAGGQLKAVVDDSFMDMVRRAMLTLEVNKPSALWIGDRTPRGLRVFLEGAPHFLVIRDGRDILVSWTYHILRMRPHVVAAVVPKELREAFGVNYVKFKDDPTYFLSHPEELLADEGWVRFVAEGWAKRMRLDHESVERIERREIDAKLMTVRFEELHADPEGGRRAMYEFLEVDPHEAAPLSKETRTTAGFEQEDPTSFWRHGQVGGWKRYSNDDFKKWFKDAAGDVLVEFGYEKDRNW
jgi:hypothetical protein